MNDHDVAVGRSDLRARRVLVCCAAAAYVLSSLLALADALATSDSSDSPPRAAALFLLGRALPLAFMTPYLACGREMGAPLQLAVLSVLIVLTAWALAGTARAFSATRVITAGLVSIPLATVIVAARLTTCLGASASTLVASFVPLAPWLLQRALRTRHGLEVPTLVLLLAVDPAIMIFGALRVEGSSGATVWPDYAYDVATWRDGSELLVTDQTVALRVSDLAARPTVTPIPGTLHVGMPERITSGASQDEVFVAVSSRGALRLRAGPDGDIGITQYEDVRAQHSAALVFDPIADRLVVLNEWGGTGAAFSVSAPDPPRGLALFDAPWPVPYVSIDADSRRGWASSALIDGSVARIDLDTLEVLYRRDGLFAYATLYDAEREVLWALRGITGELLALDPDTLEIDSRLELEAGLRRMVLEPRRGHLIINAYPSGRLFRVDPHGLRVLEVGHCGWRCRSLWVDPAHDTLWTASSDGVSRFELGARLDAPAGATGP